MFSGPESLLVVLEKKKCCSVESYRFTVKDLLPCSVGIEAQNGILYSEQSIKS